MQFRTEYPRPQMERKSYICLNGEWSFAIDTGESLPERGLFEPENYSMTITVPFCPESELSGISCKDFMNAVAYQREFAVCERKGEVLLLHFGACDYETEVYINRKLVGKHKGGYSSFSFEIQKYIIENSNNLLTIYVKDDNRGTGQPRGKQCPSYHSKVCDYTRTTGIWQTVWLEWLPGTYVTALHMTPNLASGHLMVKAKLNRWFKGILSLEASLDGQSVSTVEAALSGRCAQACLPVPNPQAWHPDHPVLYDLKLHLQGADDELKSYFGMRDISFEDNVFSLNGEKIFLRMVLDQGFYPDGIYTAPNEEALIGDILLAQKAGFNGARLHQKVFEERFLYHCDRLGYLVFGEYPDAGLSKEDFTSFLPFSTEWQECIERDYSHPSIIGWCPLNETPITRSKELLKAAYNLTRTLDPVRPVIDASGFTHVITDIYDVHDYEQNVETFTCHAKTAGSDHSWVNFPKDEQYEGQPYFVSEYGGIWWSTDSEAESWGYGNRPVSIEEFYERYEGLTIALLESPGVCGFCYTQLTDVEQEKNGIYGYDRSEKFDITRIRDINTRHACVELK